MEMQQKWMTGFLDRDATITIQGSKPGESDKTGPIRREEKHHAHFPFTADAA
jgi:hypothetical protein